MLGLNDNRIFGFLVFLIFVLLSSSLMANSHFSKSRTARTQLQDAQLEKKITSLRDKFISAEKALKKNQHKKFNRLLGQLKAYPLYPYLQYRYLLNTISLATEKDILTFIKDNADTPYAERLRKKWLDHNAKKGRWKTYLNAYNEQSSVRRQCDYLNALLQNGKKQLAFQKVESVWLNGRSQPKSCDPVFKAWEKDGHISDDLRWQRIRLAMAKGQISLANYLAKPMTKTDKAFLEQWVKLHRKPHKLLSSKPYLDFVAVKKHPMQIDLIVHVFKRLARKKPELAAKSWLKMKSKQSLSEQNKAQIFRAIGLSLARKHKNNAWYWLNKVADQYSDSEVQEWRTRAAIREQDWNATLDSINRLPESERQNLRWNYWLAEVSDEFGQTKDANEKYAQLALKRGYYGFLAADKLDMPYSFEHSPLSISKEEIKKLEVYPGILRAREFYIMRRSIEAKREWYYATSKQFNEQQRVVAAKIAQQWGWHERAILTIAHTNERNDMELRFPIKYKDKVTHFSKMHNLDDAYTYAVIRRESAFATDAHSRAGALGLMQIMPATGRSVAKKMKLRYKGKNQLLSADTNLKLGTNYLQKMLNKFNQQPVLASAAYNAGGHRVKRWLPKEAEIPAINWVETIPFKETREYVAAVLAYTSIYEHRLGKSITRLEDKMPDVPKK